MTKHVIGTAALLALAGCGGGGGGSTVPSRRINIGQEMTGQLRSGDPRLNDSSVYHLYTFSGNAGQTVQVDVMSSDFDAFVILQDAMGSELARNDDVAPGNLDARATYTLSSAGNYRIVANTLRPNAYGSYRIRLSALTVTRVRSGGSITRGTRYTGTLTATDAQMEGGKVFHYYLYTARPGETVTIDLESSAFDPLLVIQDNSGIQLQRDDDGGEGTNARLTWTFPYQGQYRIVATSFAAGRYGLYTLWVH